MSFQSNPFYSKHSFFKSRLFHKHYNHHVQFVKIYKLMKNTYFYANLLLFVHSLVVIYTKQQKLKYLDKFIHLVRAVLHESFCVREESNKKKVTNKRQTTK